MGLALLFCACSSAEEGVPQMDQVTDEPSTVSEVVWRSYVDTINVGFTLGFDYPDTLEAMSLESARAAVEKGSGNEPKADQVIWAVWMSDSSAFTIDEDVQGYLREGAEADIQGPFDVDVNGSLGRRILVGSSSTGSPIELVYFTKYGTAFSIVNRRPRSEGFDRFLKSLRTQLVELPRR